MSDQAKGPNATKEDKNPMGGLSAKGRKKFGVQKGVTNYSSASRRDKGRWVSWAMRFTGSPKPLKDAKGQPTRYALMFRAWGEKVPASVADVNAVHAKAVKRSKELKNSDSKDKSMRDDAYVNYLLDSARAIAAEHDKAHGDSTLLPCVAPACGRTFRDIALLEDHAESVHTFEDIRRILSEYIREEFGRRGDYRVEPAVPGIWTWIDDLSADWVVFMVEEGNDSTLQKASYTIVDGEVTLGETVEVRRRTVYEPVKKQNDSEDN